MASQATTKVRLVKCPRCREILQEPPNTPLYQCGGCYTVLQAKIPKNKSKDAGSFLHETDPAQKIELEHVSDDKEASPSQKSTLLSMGEPLLDYSKERDHNEFGNCTIEHPGGKNFSDRLLSADLAAHENEESSPEAGVYKAVDEECSLDQSNGRNQNAPGDCSKEHPGGVNLSNKSSSSTELTSHENEVPSPEAEVHREGDEQCFLDQNNDICSSADLTRHENEVSLAEAEVHREGDEQCFLDQNNDISSSTDLTRHENEVSLAEAEVHREGDEQCFLDQNNDISSSADLTRHENEVSSAEASADREVDEESYLNQDNRISSSAELKSHEYEVSSPEASADNEVDEECYLDKNKGISSLTEITTHENEMSSPEAGTHTEVDEKWYLDQNNGISSSNELTSHENEVSSPEAGARGEVDKEFYLDQNSGISSSTGLTSQENEVSLPEAGARREANEEFYLNQDSGRGQTVFGDCNKEQPGDANFSSEASAAEFNSHLSPTDGTYVEVDGNINSYEVPSSTEFTCHEIEETSPITGENDNFKSRFIFKSASLENLRATRPKGSAVTAERPLGGSILSNSLESSYNELLEQSQNSVLQEFRRVRSIDTLENSPTGLPSSELSVALMDMPKSPTTRSYYAYDGSVSSYDEIDDQVPNWNLRPLERNLKDADYVNEVGDALIVDDSMRIDTDMEHQSRNFSSFSAEKKHYAMKGSKWHGDELLEPTRYVHPVRSRVRLEAGECLSRLPYHSGGFQAGYEHGSPSRYGHNEFHHNSSSYPPDKPEYSEHDKMTLLRMVHELQDQLNRTYISKGKANGKFPSGVVTNEKLIPSYYDHVTPEDMRHDLNYPRYGGRCHQGKRWSQQCECPQMHFSGEAARRHQFDNTCLHCCPQERHCSAQLPLQSGCCGEGHYRAHSGRMCYNLYRPSSSSPQQYTSSEFSSLSYDMKSDDYVWRRDLEVKKSRLRDRQHLVKRHFRPMAGGAPFISCYRCSELLRLPEDFLLFGRTCHRLKCGACSAVLKYSLQDRTHIVPYTATFAAPPPSEVDDTSGAMNRTLASTSQVSDWRHTDPISCSDDCGPSFCRSCSTEGEPISLTPPFPIPERNSTDRKMSSGSSFDYVEEKKKKLVTRESRNKYKNRVETFESPRTSSNYKSIPKKLSKEIEELRPSSGSPLHRLMGYSSPSQVIRE